MITHAFLNHLLGAVRPTVGVYLCLELEGVPQAVVERLRTHGFLMAFGLFAHEQKLSVLHCSLQKTSAGCWTEPIKSKEELLFQVWVHCTLHPHDGCGFSCG